MQTSANGRNSPYTFMKKTTPDKTAVLLVNTGTPTAPTPAAVKTYLSTFLSDRHVVDLPNWIWQPILKTIILRTRPPRSAAKYREIWQPEGSPLLHFSEQLKTGLEKNLAKIYENLIPVQFAMLYGEPDIEQAIVSLQQRGYQKMIVLPLFPQFSSATTAAVLDRINKTPYPATILAQYYDHPAYIKALAEQLGQHWASQGQAEKILFSFHGIPQKRIRLGDPYENQCRTTIRKLAETLNLQPHQFEIGFQSRFGGGQWLKPDSKEILVKWARTGIQDIQVFAPGFPIDCLETLHEIEIELTALFKQNGGKHLSYIPALNAAPSHINAITEILAPYLTQELI